jgi:hypothetical protein
VKKGLTAAQAARYQPRRAIIRYREETGGRWFWRSRTVRLDEVDAILAEIKKLDPTAYAVAA